jgi:hypothetical protein
MEALFNEPSSQAQTLTQKQKGNKQYFSIIDSTGVNININQFSHATTKRKETKKTKRLKRIKPAA